MKSVGAIGKNKSVGPDGISGEILKLGREAMIPYLARLLDVQFIKKNPTRCNNVSEFYYSIFI